MKVKRDIAEDLAVFRYGQCVYCDAALLMPERWEHGYCCNACAENRMRHDQSLWQTMGEQCLIDVCGSWEIH